MEQAAQLLLIDADPLLCRAVSDYLRGHGFDLSICHDGKAGTELALEGDFDLVILADALPGVPGIEILRRIRRHGELPVVMLSANDDDIERIVGLELGADDFISKSCQLRELVARLNAILRRTQATVIAQRRARSGIPSLGLSPSGRSASWRGKPLHLTSTEFNILQLLFDNSGRAIGKAELATHALGRNVGRYERSLDMHISNLRKKLGALGDGRSPIQTLHGKGYQLIVN